ncbi:hypothetical protein DSO57_1002881 [Entomophthora muscae]|uniref:Uncharacterized protein n=1 Tax=Entomophthora muscae TaxID=34485 RepID=A0ACC2TVW0_9FUNG|nr:hypothetical protein DSO57_1002881 [Entomophthora muscae]
MSLIKVAYYDPFGLWPHVKNELQAFLPLQSLRFKLPQRPMHIASHLELNFVPFEMEFIKRTPADLFRDPMLYIFLMGSDNLDTYRQVVRPQASEWHKNVNSRKGAEWLIIQVTNAGTLHKNGGHNPDLPSSLSPDSGAKPILLLRNGNPVSPKAAFNGSNLSPSGIISQLKGSPADVLIEKIKSDFKDGRRERVCPIKLHDQSSLAQDYWRFLLDSFRDIICSTFDHNYAVFEDEVKKLDNHRRFPGWNFCTFFIIKENIAYAFETLHLYQESLKLYDELEAVFLQASQELHESWFTEVGGDAPSDMSNNILDYSRKPFRDLIATNQISLFDFRMYLFARQMDLLLTKICDMKEFAARALSFIATFSHSFFKLKGKTLGAEMSVYAWTYSACKNLFKATDDRLEWEIHTDRHSKNESVSLDFKLSVARSSLLLMARAQLDRLGILCSQLPLRAPFIHSFDKPKQPALDAQIASKPIGLLNCPKLEDVLSSKDMFDSYYVSLCQKIKAECELSGRPRLMLATHNYMAALHFDRSRFSAVIALLGNIEQYLDEQWYDIASSSLDYLIEAYGLEGLWEQRVHICLKALASPTLPEGQRLHLNQKLLDSLQNVSEEVTCGLAPHLRLESIQLGDTTGTFSINIGLVCQLAKELKIDSIQAQLKSSDGLWINYFASNVHLTAGFNSIPLACEHPAIGNCSLDLVVVKLGMLTLSQGFSAESHRISFYKDPFVLQINSDLFSDSLVVEVYSESNQVTDGCLKLEALDHLGKLGDMARIPAFIRVEHGQMHGAFVELFKEDGSISLRLPSMAPRQSVFAILPCSPKAGLCNKFALSCQLSYKTQDDISIIYRQVIKTSLGEEPFSAQHCWLPKTHTIPPEYFLSFKLRTPQNTLPQRIYLVQIQPVSEEDDASPSTECISPLGTHFTSTLFPGQSLDYIFEMPQLSNATKQIYVMVRYCSILKEVELALEILFTPLLLPRGLLHHRQTLSELLGQKILQSGYLSQYAMSGSLHIGFIENAGQELVDEPALFKVVEEFCCMYPCLEVHFIKGLLSDHRNLCQTFAIKRDVTYPKSIYVKVAFEEKESLQLGDCCEITYRLELHSKTYLDVIVLVNDNTLPDSKYWAITGKTKLTLNLIPGEPQSFTVMATPMHVGFIRFPQLHICLKEPTELPPEVIYPQQSQQIRVSPPTASDPKSIATHPPLDASSYDQFSPKYLPSSLPTTLTDLNKPSPLPVPRLMSPRSKSRSNLPLTS